jgi:hypothetical protein
MAVNVHPVGDTNATVSWFCKVISGLCRGESAALNIRSTTCFSQSDSKGYELQSYHTNGALVDSWIRVRVAAAVFFGCDAG